MSKGDKRNVAVRLVQEQEDATKAAQEKKDRKRSRERAARIRAEKKAKR